MRHLLAALLWLSASATPPACAAEGSHSAVGDVRLAPGLDAHYAYHYDRNALSDSRLASDTLIALTRSGNLLRFDAKTLTLTREWFGPVPATCLGRGEDDAVLVGFEDGRVCRVDPATLAPTEVVKLPGKIQWVGESKTPGTQAGIVAVVEQPLQFDRQGRRTFGWSTEIHDLATGKVLPLPMMSGLDVDGRTTWQGGRPSAFLLDSKRRLWLGGDQGEWGGWLVRADLDLGRVEPVFCFSEGDGYPGGWSGIYGLAELPDGQVWAHGGTMHMGLAGGFISRVDGSFARDLYLYDNDDDRGGDDDNRVIPERRPPYLPTTHILPDGNGKIIVFAYSDIYRVDTGLKEWAKDLTLSIRYRWGRPDAVGAYPSIVAVHRLDDRLICATGVDGYISIADGKDVSHALPGQFGLDRTWRIAGSAEGTLFSPWDDREPTWRHADNGWEVADFAPPCEPDPADEWDEGGKPKWSQTRVLTGPGGTAYTFNSRNLVPSTRTTARRVGGKSENIGRERSHLYVSYCFITPDGALWNASFGDLKRLVDGRWQSVAALPGAGPLDGQGFRTGDTNFPVGYGLQAIGDDGPPWLLLDRDRKQILFLTYDPNFKDPKLDAVKVAEVGATLKVLDAIPWSKGELLLATDKGLRLLDIASAKVQPSPLPVPDLPITSLARDGLGRIWMAGEGLWVVDPDGKRLHDCGPLPMIGRTPVATIAADPNHRDGVIVSLGERGVAFVRISAEAAR